MADQLNLSSQQLELLKQAPALVFRYVSFGESGGMFSGQRELQAYRKYLSNTDAGNSKMVQAMLQGKDSAAAFGREDAAQTKEKLTEIGRLIDSETDTAEGDKVRSFLVGLGEAVAAAAREERRDDDNITEREEEILDDLREALQATPQQIRQRRAQRLSPKDTADEAEQETTLSEAEKQRMKREVEQRAAERRRRKAAEKREEAQAAASASPELSSLSEEEKQRMKREVEQRAAERRRRKAAEDDSEQEEQERDTATAQPKATPAPQAPTAAEKTAPEAATEKQQPADQQQAAAQQSEQSSSKQEAAAPRVPTAASGQKTADQEEYASYVVQSGDTLSHISLRFYGSANRWREIFEANRDILDNPNMIFPGQKLKIPRPNQSAE